MKKLLSATFAAAAILLASHTEGLACSCAPNMVGSGKVVAAAVDRARDSADAVFVGTVLEISNNGSGGVASVAVRFKVERSWKGQPAEEIVVLTQEGRGGCGFPFERGAAYLVYSNGKKELYTTICHRTAPLADAAEDLKMLGEGKAVGESHQFHIPPELTVVVLSQTRPKRLDDEVSQTDMTVRLKFMNKGEQPLLINKKGIGVSHLWIGKSENHLQNNEFKTHTAYTLIPMQKAATVKLGDFAVLSPNMSVEMDVAFSVLVLNDPNVRVGGAIAKGEHFFRIQVTAWYLDSNETRPLQERFKSRGTILTKAVTSTATKFVVD